MEKLTTQAWAEKYEQKVIISKATQIGWSEVTPEQIKALVKFQDRKARSILALLLSRQRLAYKEIRLYQKCVRLQDGRVLRDKINYYIEARNAANSVRELLNTGFEEGFLKPL